MAAFQIKDFVSIAASLTNMMQAQQQKVTDFNIGSVVRTMLEAIAAEIDQLYQQMLNGLLQAIPVSVYNSFQFGALTAQSASGLMDLTISSQATPTLLVAGTVFTSVTTGNTYATSVDYTFPIGQTTATVPVVATVPGSASNLGADSDFVLSPAPAGFISATNPNAFIDGTDDETPAEQLIRFNGFISTLQRATDAAIVYGAQTSFIVDSSGNVIERVASAVVVEPYLTDNTQPISSIFCYIFNGSGGTSTALVTQTQKVVNGYTNDAGVKIPGYKAAGVVCSVVAVTEQPLNITAVLTAAPGYVHDTLVSQAQSVLTAYQLSILAGAPAIFALIESLVMAIPGVANFVISTPTADTAATGANYKIMPGTTTIT